MNKKAENGVVLLKKLEAKPKIGFAVLAHNRPEYLELCLDSLFRTKLYDYDVTFLIQDDGSDDPKVREIIEKPRNSEYKIVRSFTTKGHNSWGAAFNKAMRKLLEIDDFDIIGSCDSDAIFHPEWLNETLKVCLWAKEHHGEHILGPFSSFNSSDYIFHRILGTYKSPFGDYVVKERMGALNYLYFKEDFLKLGFYPESKDDETLMTEKFKELGVKYFSTNVSYVEHVGQDSVLNQWRPTIVDDAVYGMNLAEGDWGMDLKKIRSYPLKVSVIMPVYNRENFLKESIGSILNQTFSEFEFIIVDDASTDSSFEIIEEYAKEDKRIKLLRNLNKKGIVGALTTAINAAQGEYIVRMDSDDISLPERIEKQILYMDRNLEVGACGTWVRLFDGSDGTWELPTDPDVIKCTMFFCGAIANPSAIIRRKIFSDLGFSYDDSFVVAEDYDFWTRLADSFKLSNLPEVLFLYRIHSSNTGSVYSNEHNESPFRIYERLIRNIGIKPSLSSVDFHKRISEAKYSFKKSFIRQMEDWFCTVKKANEKSGIYNKHVLDDILEKKKREVYEAYELYKKNRNFLQAFIDNVKELLKAILPEAVSNWIGVQIHRSLSLVYRIKKHIGKLVRKNMEITKARLGIGIKLSKRVNKNFKIGMAVLSYERPEYLELCLDSLFKTKLYNYDITFLINDDGSENPLVKKIIEEQRDLKYKIVRNYTPKGPNCAGAAINKAVRKLLEIDNFDIIGWCDSDALFHPEWLDKTMKICLWAKENHKNHILGPFSSFNSSDYMFHRILGTYKSPFGKYVVKRQMGMLNYFYFKEDFLKLGYFPENKDDETLMTEKFEKMGVRNFCTHNSYVEHLGQESVLNKWRPCPIKRAVHGMHLARGDWGYDLEKLSPYSFYKYLKGSCTSGNNIESSDRKVDVIIPAIEKDLNILPMVVESVRKNLYHPIGEIIVIGPNKKEISGFCQKYGCIFRDEDSVLPIKLKDINYKVNGVNRSGWIFQQLLKLNSDNISSEKYAYIIDADTVLVKPQKFESNGKLLFLASDEYHTPYHKIFEKIFGYPTLARFSFVSHQMFFDLNRLSEMKKEMEQKNANKKWYEIILENLDKNESSSFSEYETYGNWMKINHPEEIFVEYWNNKALPASEVRMVHLYPQNTLRRFRSLSFHSYNSKSNFTDCLKRFLKGL